MHTQLNINEFCNLSNGNTRKVQVVFGAFLLISVSGPTMADSPLPLTPSLDPPSITREILPDLPPITRPRAATPYSHGDPTAEEQLLLEMVNRARANPPAEGARLASTTDPDVLSAYSFFSVNLAQLHSMVIRYVRR
jgi:hypothetical protein